jgi:transglutaminase-like putative cysteine protease
MRRGIFVAAVVSAVGVALAVWAQTPAPTVVQNAPVEVVRNHITYDIAADGTFTKKQEEVFRILSSQGLQLLRQYPLLFSASYQDADFTDAYTLKKDGTRIPVPAEKIFLSYGPVTEPGFNDLKIKTAVFQNVEVGDEVGVATVFRQKTPWFPGQFFATQAFSQALPQHDVQIDVHASTRLPLHIDFAGLDGGQTQTSGDTQSWTWTFHNDNSVMPEPASVSENTAGGDLIVSSFPDYGALAKAYEDGARAKALPTPQVKALADQLTQGVTGKREQARLLYDWVSKNIKYLAITLGNGGLVPHAANEILSNRYGDCKDHVVLLQAMLAAEDIPSTAVLIFAGNSFKLSPVAAPDQFNHAITYVPQLDLYLDSTVGYAPFGVLPEQDMDRPVLLTAQGTIAHTPGPSVYPEISRVVTDVHVHDDGSADADTRISMTGGFAIAMRASMEELIPGTESEFIRNAVPGATDGTLDKGDPTNLADPYAMSAHYTMARAVNVPGPGAASLWIGYHPFPMVTALTPGLQNRHTDYLCSSFTATDEETITLPDSLSLTGLPKAAEVDTEGYSLTVSYERQGPHAVHVTRTLKAQHPHQSCSAEVYNRIRPDLTKMFGILSTQALYK